MTGRRLFKEYHISPSPGPTAPAGAEHPAGRASLPPPGGPRRGAAARPTEPSAAAGGTRRRRPPAREQTAAGGHATPPPPTRPRRDQAAPGARSKPPRHQPGRFANKGRRPAGRRPRATEEAPSKQRGAGAGGGGVGPAPQRRTPTPPPVDAGTIDERPNAGTMAGALRPPPLLLFFPGIPDEAQVRIQVRDVFHARLAHFRRFHHPIFR